eukprot:SAG31_NODE_1681_length_7537_cov_71.109572_6_plen_360_part_00
MVPSSLRAVSLLAVSVLCFNRAIGQRDVCGRPCESDVQCPDARGVCTYCTGNICQPPAGCVGGPEAANTSKPQLLVIGDSISLGWSPVLFPLLRSEFESQHVPTNAGPASKGFACARSWVGDVQWDVVLFNFGLHSLDRHRLPDGSATLPTGEAETLTNYTREIQAIAALLKKHSRRVIWVDTTPVPLNVTAGPERHNQDVIQFNAAANDVMNNLQIETSDVYGAVMDVCPDTSGPPDHTYTECNLQSLGGVHFPGHYDVLVAVIYKSVTGKPAPPPPPPISCKQSADKVGCVDSKGAGMGQACAQCYTNSKVQFPRVFDGPACLANYSNHVPKLLHPQESFVQCWCFNKSWGGYSCEP